jgi:hypothetical protein
MRYALNLSDDGRILSATEERFAAPGQPIVETLPDGDIADWLYQGEDFVYDPLPKPPEPEVPDTVRIQQLEQALAAFIGGITSVQ